MSSSTQVENNEIVAPLTEPDTQASPVIEIAAIPAADDDDSHTVAPNTSEPGDSQMHEVGQAPSVGALTEVDKGKPSDCLEALKHDVSLSAQAVISYASLVESIRVSHADNVASFTRAAKMYMDCAHASKIPVETAVSDLEVATGSERITNSIIRRQASVAYSRRGADTRRVKLAIAESDSDIGSELESSDESDSESDSDSEGDDSEGEGDDGDDAKEDEEGDGDNSDDLNIDEFEDDTTKTPKTPKKRLVVELDDDIACTPPKRPKTE